MSAATSLLLKIQEIKPMNTIVQAEIPQQLCQQAQLLIEHGWAKCYRK